jgi:hypothetical protein
VVTTAPADDRPRVDRPRDDRPRDDRPRDDRPRDDRPREARPDRGPRDDRGPRGPRPDRNRDLGRGGRPLRGATPPAEGKEFWEVWSEEVGRTNPEGVEGVEGVEGAAPPAARSTVVAGDEAAPPFPPDPGDNGQARLYLNLGRKDGASEGDVSGLIAAEGITVGPGDLDVMNTHTYVNVPAGEAERLRQALSGKEHNGRTLVCEPARPPRRR